MSALDTCALCPRLCRSACPVATGTAREAAAPTQIASVLLDHARGKATAEEALQAATLCVDCGACEHHCHLHRPLPEALRAARAALGPVPAVAPLAPPEGDGEWVMVECDERPLARWLSLRLGAPVRRWPTADGLGEPAVGHPSFAGRAAALRDAASGLRVVVTDAGSARALGAAGVPFRWLEAVLPDLGRPEEAGSCASGGPAGLACCGGVGPLPRHHPEDARRVARLWAERGEVRAVRDARCRAHLAGAGLDLPDLAERLRPEGA